MFIGSVLRNQGLGAEHLRGGLIQHLPSHRRVLVADLSELSPELTAGRGLNARGGDVLRGTLIPRGLNALGLLGLSLSCGGLRRIQLHLGRQAVAGGLHRIGAVLTEELIDIVAQHRGVCEHHMVCRVVFRGGLDDNLMLLEVFAQLLDRLNGLGELAGILFLESGNVVRLLDESVLEDGRVSIKQSRGLLAEVLENLQALVTYCVEIPVPCACRCLLRRLTLSQSRRLLLSRGIGRRYLGQGDRLRRIECRCRLVVPRHH